MPLDNSPRTAGSVAVSARGSTVPVFIGTEELRDLRFFINETDNSGNTVYGFIIGIGWAGALVDFDVYINDQPAPAGVIIKKYMGAAGQGIDPAIAAVIPGYAETMIVTEGVETPVPLAYFSAIVPDGAEIAGAPNFSVVADGGNGTPVEKYAAFLRSKIWGRGRSVNQASIDAQILINNAPIGGENRHTLNKVLNKPQDIDSLSSELAGYAGVFAHDDGDEIYLVPDRPAASSAVFSDEGDDAEIVRGSLKPSGVAPGPTVVTVKFTNTSKIPYSSDEVTVSLAGVDNGTVPHRAELIRAGGVTVKQAKRIALRALKETELVTTLWTFRLTDEGIRYRIGTVATISSEAEKLDAIDVRIIAVPETSVGRFEYRAVTYAPGVYTDDFSGTLTTYNPIEDLPNSIAAPVITSVQSFFESIEGKVTYGVKAIIAPPDDPHFDKIFAEASLDAGATWRRMPERENSTTAWLENLKEGTTVQVRAKAENTFRVKSGWSSIVSGTVDVTPAPPPSPNSITGYGRADGSREISIGQPTLPSDYNNTGIRYSTFATGGWNEAGPRQDTRDDRSMDGFNIPTGTYYIQAINYDSGGRSSTPKVAGPFNFGSDKEAVKSAQDAATTAADEAARRTNGTSFRDSASGIDSGIQTADQAARYEGTAFRDLYPPLTQLISDNEQDVQDAVYIAGTKNRIITRTTQPADWESQINDMWINPNNGNRAKIREGAGWWVDRTLVVSSLAAWNATLGEVWAGIVRAPDGGYMDLDALGTNLISRSGNWWINWAATAQFETVYSPEVTVRPRYAGDSSVLNCQEGTFRFNPYDAYVVGGGFNNVKLANTFMFTFNDWWAAQRGDIIN